MRRRPHGGRFSRPPFRLRPEDGLAGAGLGLVTPGDVLAYRTAWDQYVLDTTRVATRCSGDYALAAAGLQNTFPKDADAFNAAGQAIANAGQALLGQWNVFANKSDSYIVLQGASILEQYQATVLSAGQLRNTITKGVVGPQGDSFACPLVYLDASNQPVFAVDGVDPNVQAQIIARIQGLGILADGVLQILVESTGNALVEAGSAAQWAAQQGKKIVETTTSYLPWIIAGVATIGAAGVALVYAPEIKLALRARPKKAAA